MKKIFTLVIICIAGTALYGQVTPVKIEKGLDGMYPSYMEFSRDAAPDYNKGSLYLPGPGNQRSASLPILLQSQTDAKGKEHSRFQQTLNKIPIEGAVYITHASKGKVLSQNGKWIQNFPADIISSAGIGKDAAIKAAMGDFGATSYKWQSADEEQFIKRESNNKAATFYPKPELVYYTGEEEITPFVRLAYKLDLYASEPIGRRIYFIDANSAEVLGRRDLIHTTDAAGTAVTGYSGTQPITTDLNAGVYRLREIGGRGNGIQTYNLQKGTNYGAAVDFTDADNNWNNVNANLDQYATDAHWGAERTYDYFKTKFNRNSIDNNGFALKSYVHYSTNYFNAFWDGSRMTYGDGNSTDNFKPLTSIDVAGHEITHGLTSNTANLNYSNESGALNESFSDIFGTAIEVFARPTQNDWLIGADFYTIRSMINPNAYSDPDTYKGTYWYTGTGDNGGVHTNSGVLNFWFYLLSAGGSGTNDFGTAYNVTAITIDKAAAIAYRTLTYYLISTSKYADCRTYSIKAAEDIYGVGSAEAVQTTNAWIAVGVGASAPPVTCTDVYEANESRNASKTIPLNTDINASISTSNDKDWFTFTTSSTAPNLNITLGNLAGDYDIKLYNNSGKQLRVSQNSGTTSETINYNASGGKTYYVQVYGYAGASSTSCYLLRVNTSGTAYVDEAGNAGITSTKMKDMERPMLVYPNPARSSVQLQFTLEDATQKDIIIMDALGRIVYNKQWTVQKGINTLRINLPKLKPGNYFIKAGTKQVQQLQIIP